MKVSTRLAVVVPREQFINPVELVVGNVAEDVGELKWSCFSGQVYGLAKMHLV